MKASPAQIDPQMSRQFPSHQMSALGPQLQDIQGVKHSYVQCMKGRYCIYVIKFTPEGRHCGPPFCVQHLRHSSLDLKGV